MEEKQNNKSAIIIILILVVAAGIFGFFYFKSLYKNPSSESSDVALDLSLGQNSETSKVNMEDTKELKIEDLTAGSGAEATNGKSVTVHYVGTLLDGTKFDSSRDRGTPFTFNLGTGEVIKGWDLGVLAMKVGGKRKLTIPGDLAYGPYGAPPDIGPNATLVFEVELLEVK